MYFNDWLSRRCLYTPERWAVFDDGTGQRYRYADLNRRATQVASFLQRRLNVQPGDRVACLSANRIEYLDLYFACSKIGAVLVPFNIRLPASALLELLVDCQPQVLAYEPTYGKIATSAGMLDPTPQMLPIEASSDSGVVESLSDVLVADHADASPEIYRADESDVAMILYTSGTTGRSKGAMISYRQIHWNALNTIIGLQLTQEDTALLNMPLYHTGGWHVLFTPLMLVGGRVVLQKGFDPVRCNARLGPDRITILFGVPTTLRMMKEATNFAAADLSSVRFAIFGGESCPMPLIQAYAERGVAMRQGYGLTEAGPNCFSLPAEDAIRKSGSIGFPNFHVAARLIKDDGSEAGPGEVGELWMSGPHLFAGYWASPDETAKVMCERWLATGDLMSRDDDGYFYFVGRKKEMYVSGGENVYPAQVERILQRHESIALAAVIGVPDPKWGETGWAFVQLKPECRLDEAQLIAWCKQHLATFQCPSKIIPLESFPIGTSGKIDKRSLVELVLRQDQP